MVINPSVLMNSDSASPHDGKYYCSIPYNVSSPCTKEYLPGAFPKNKN